jgi:acylphosphatase
VPLARLHLFVSGRVQGVSFRAHTADVARGLGLAGWVRNLPDGRVEALAEGPRPALEALADWCRRGPPLARVDALDLRWGEPDGNLGSFAVRRG